MIILKKQKDKINPLNKNPKREIYLYQKKE